jgi:soluble lytic murein transglycosylase-like protein
MMNWLPSIRPASLAGSAAAVIGTLALVTVSCAAPGHVGRAPSASVVLPGIPGIVRVQTEQHAARIGTAGTPGTSSSKTLDTRSAGQALPLPYMEQITSAPALPAVVEAPVLVVEPAPEPAPVEAVAAPEPIGPLPGGTAFIPQVEAWRGLVRELIAEARAEGRLNGHAGKLDEDLVLAIMQQESGGNPNAMSPVGARGLLQLMPASFAWIMGIANWGQDISHMDRSFIFDPSTNVRAGIRFLGAVLEEQGGNLYWALASYNAGGGVVNLWRYRGLTEIPEAYGRGETAHYVPTILANYNAHRPA